MADFSFLSDTDDSAVEDLISQARDLCVLEQVAAINCSGFVDSVLPTDLESRFSRLKSFPATTAKPKPKPRSSHASSARYESDFASKSHLANEDFSPAKQDPLKKIASQSKSSSGSLSSPPLDSKRGSVSIPLNSSSSSSSSNSSPKTAHFSSSKRSLDKKKRFVSRSETGSFSPPLGTSKSSRKSLSPPRKLGCFWCSPKKGSARKSKGEWTDSDDFGWSKNEELLADLGSFPIKEQRKILKKAMVEQKKISREAQKIVKLAKQASLRTNVSGIDDELSDD